MIDQKIVAWAQYLHWADINFNRFMSSEDDIASSIGIAFQWFASEYVAIEGWKEIELESAIISKILEENEEGIGILRRARNAVFHFQVAPLEKRLFDFASEFGSNGWLIDLHQAFLAYLLDYPASIYPYDYRREEFGEKFFELAGWKPCLLRS